MDIKTIVLSYLITNAVCAGVIWTLYLQNRKHFDGLRFWLAAYIVQFAGLTLIILRDYLPDFLSTVVGNGLFIGGTILLYIGLEHFLGKRSNQFHNYAILALFVVAHAFFLVVRPSMTARSVNLSLALIVLCAQFAWLIFHRVDAKLRPIAREAGFLFVAYGAVSLIRIFVNLVMPLDEDFFQLGLFDAIVFMAYQILFIGLTFSLFMMVNRRLLLNLQEDILIRREAEGALRFSEEKFQKAFDSSPDSVTITRSRDGKIVEVNQGFIRTTGYSRDEVLSSTTVALQIWANLQDRDSFIHILQKEHAVRNVEYDFRTKSGAILTGLVSAEIIQLENERHIVSVIHDITERKRAEKKLQQAQAHIIEQQRAVAAFEEREQLARIA